MKLLCGGEPLAEDLARALLATGAEVYNLYGPTETTVWSSSKQIGETGPVALGEPVAGTSLYLLDAQFRPVLPGMRGEIFIAGRGVARGYLNRPDLTAEKFLPDPFGAPGARMYRTGDYARRNQAEQLIFLGRADRQVKIRGFRVELAEIERVIAAHPDVTECAVVAGAFTGGDLRLIAFLTAAAGRSIDPAAIRRLAARALPEHAVPSLIVPLAALPLTANGKVDRNRLKEFEPNLRDESAVTTAPVTIVQEVLTQLWANLLGGDAPGIHDNFFSASGHSLLASRMLARVRDIFGIELPLAAIFESPTIAALAAAIENRLGQTPASPAARSGAGQDAWPLSPGQQRLWFLYELNPSSPDYNMVLAFRLRSNLDRDALERSIQLVARRHSILSSRFFDRQGQGWQVPGACPPAISFLDFSGADALSRARQAAHVEASRPFDLRSGPVFRVLAATVAPDEHVIVLILHHIVADGWSLGLLASELSAAYASRGEETGNLPRLELQYHDFAAWHGEWMEQVSDAQARFWSENLRGATPLELPEAPDGSGGGRIVVNLAEDLTSRLDNFGSRHSLTLFMMHVAAAHAAIYSLTGQTDQVIGTDLAYRRWPGTENLVGFFVNSVPLRVNLAGYPSLLEIAERVRTALLGAYAHQDLPFDRILTAAVLRRRGADTPFINFLAVSGEMASDVRGIRSAKIEPIELPPARPKFKLCLFASREKREINLTWLWQKDHFSAEITGEIARRQKAILTTMIEDSSRKLSALDLQPAEAPRADPLAGLQSHRRVPRTARSPVSTELLSSGCTSAVLLRPGATGLDATGWIAGQRNAIDEHLRRHGAVLFRGFAIETETAFENFASALCSPLYGEYGDLPHEPAHGAIYHSTPYPREYRIHYHNESSHLNLWPKRQFFCCVVRSFDGGETPLADGAAVLAELPQAVRQAFEQKGLLYVRHFAPNLDVGWRDFFHTEDRAVVEQHCARTNVECCWLDGERLVTRARRPAVITHPETGQPVFFNQIQVHHPACLPAPVHASMAGLFGGNFPRNVFFGDGSPIPDEMVREIQAIYDRVALVFPWQRGDVLVVDNIRMAHARNPFSGPRRILVAMGDMTRQA